MLEKIKQKYDKKLETDFLSEALEIVENRSLRSDISLYG